MRALTSTGCLELWERGRHLHPFDRGLLALSFSMPEISPEAFADWALGRRNEALLQLYRGFGGSLQAWTSCERCGEKMELDLDVREFLAERKQDLEAPPVVVMGGRSFRLPTSRDLASIAEEVDHRQAALRLIERCQVEGEPCDMWTAAEMQEIEERMEAADPLAEIRLSLSCPVCGFSWDESLEIARFLWAEIEARGKRLLWEVHTLARAYGWSEREILRLSDSRRGLYLEMNGGVSSGAGMMR